MTRLSTEQLLGVVMNEDQFGYQPFALKDVAAMSDEELGQFLVNTILCLSIDNGRMVFNLIGESATKQKAYYFDIVSQLGGTEIYPREVVKMMPNDPSSMANAQKIANEFGIPLAFLSFLESSRSGEVVVKLSVLPGVNPHAILNTITQYFNPGDKSASKQRLN